MGWGSQKPPFGTPLDYNHPSTLGLRWALPFNEGRGATLYNPLRHVTTTLSYPTLGATATWMGPGLDFGATTTSLVDLGAQADLVNDFTVLMRVKTDTVAGLRTFFGMNSSGGAERVTGSLYLESAKVSYWEGSGNDHVLVGVQTLAVNTWYTVGFARQATGGSPAWNLTSYVNGTQEETATNNRTPSTASAGNLRVGFAGSYTGAPWDGLIDWFFLWTRALSLTEIQQIQAAPFDLYYRAPSLWFVPQGGGGGTAVPVFYHHLQTQGIA